MFMLGVTKALSYDYHWTLVIILVYFIPVP